MYLVLKVLEMLTTQITKILSPIEISRWWLALVSSGYFSKKQSSLSKSSEILATDGLQRKTRKYVDTLCVFN